MYRVRHSCRFCGESRNRSFVKHVIEKHYSGAGIRGTIVDETTIANVTCQTVTRCRADSRFATSQWETALLCNDVSYWLGACQWLLGVTPVQSSIAPLLASPRCRRASGTQEQEYPPPLPLGTADPATVRRESDPRIIGDHPGAGVPTR